MTPLDRPNAPTFPRNDQHRRYSKSFPVKNWPGVFAGNEVIVPALLDRLLHRCHIFNIKGRSYRLRDLQAHMK